MTTKQFLKDDPEHIIKLIDEVKEQRRKVEDAVIELSRIERRIAYFLPDSRVEKKGEARWPK